MGNQGLCSVDGFVQVTIFMGMWWFEAQRISNASFWFEGSELHVLPFGWTIHATFGVIVLAATVAWFATVVAGQPLATRIECAKSR